MGNIKNELNYHTGYVYALLALKNGDLVSAGLDKAIQIWDTNNWTIKRTLTGHTGMINDLKDAGKIALSALLMTKP